MTAKEIKNYIDMMKHTLNRRMDSQAGKEELIKKYTEKMEQGLNAIEELEAIKSIDVGEAIKRFNACGIRKAEGEYCEKEDTDFIESTLLKAQAQEQELRELKEKVNHFLNYIDDWAESSSLDNFETYSIIKNGDILDDLLDELENLCKGSEDYVTQQKAKDERHAKESELLRLYREKDDHIENWENYDRNCDMGYIAKLEHLQRQIKRIEGELKNE